MAFGGGSQLPVDTPPPTLSAPRGGRAGVLFRASNTCGCYGSFQDLTEECCCQVRSEACTFAPRRQVMEALQAWSSGWLTLPRNRMGPSCSGCCLGAHCEELPGPSCSSCCLGAQREEWPGHGGQSDTRPVHWPQGRGPCLAQGQDNSASLSGNECRNTVDSLPPSFLTHAPPLERRTARVGRRQDAMQSFLRVAGRDTVPTA